VFKIICIFMSIFIASIASAQEAVIDPTKPLNFSAANLASGSSQQTIQLTSILISSERRVAIINGEVLSESQTVKGVGALVKKIDAEAVTFQQNGKVWRVALNSTAIRK
jgi:MSHA biogenesis protein MshK